MWIFFIFFKYVICWPNLYCSNFDSGLTITPSWPHQSQSFSTDKWNFFFFFLLIIIYIFIILLFINYNLLTALNVNRTLGKVEIPFDKRQLHVLLQNIELFYFWKAWLMKIYVSMFRLLYIFMQFSILEK